MKGFYRGAPDGRYDKTTGNAVAAYRRDRGMTAARTWDVPAWIRLHACEEAGYLVIDMTRSCFVRQSYTRGDCRLPRVTAY